jgi:hypothetical protein
MLKNVWEIRRRPEHPFVVFEISSLHVDSLFQPGIHFYIRDPVCFG